MKKSRSFLRGFLSLILALVLLRSIVPNAFASDSEEITESASVVNSNSIPAESSSTPPESSSVPPESSGI